MTENALWRLIEAIQQELGLDPSNIPTDEFFVEYHFLKHYIKTDGVIFSIKNGEVGSFCCDEQCQIPEDTPCQCIIISEGDASDSSTTKDILWFIYAEGDGYDSPSGVFFFLYHIFYKTRKNA